MNDTVTRAMIREIDAVEILYDGKGDDDVINSINPYDDVYLLMDRIEELGTRGPLSSDLIVRLTEFMTATETHPEVKRIVDRTLTRLMPAQAEG